MTQKSAVLSFFAAEALNHAERTLIRIFDSSRRTDNVIIIINGTSVRTEGGVMRNIVGNL